VARARAGSVLFDLPEVRCVLDDEGRPTAIVPRRSYTAYHLIEEFMLAANQAVAGRLHAAGYPVPYRVHEPPNEDQWEAMRQELAALGFPHKVESRADINRITAPVEGQPIARIVHLSVLRNMNQARYTAECGEHFGLAFEQYLHFTSPIRRYPDLIAHRVLCALEQGQPPPYSAEQVESIAAQCSRTERTAAEAEQASVDIKRLEYFADQLQQGHTGPYRALVTGMNRRGYWIELEDSLQRGWVPFSGAQRDGERSTGRTRGKGKARRAPAPWRVGSEVQVDMVRIDTARKCVDFRPAGTRQGHP
jgi:ribonuclease R